MTKLKIAAIILFVLQGFALIGALLADSLSGPNVLNIIGFFLFSIVGVILLIIDRKRNS